LRPNSSTEKALRIALKAAAAEGVDTLMLGGPDLVFPSFGQIAIDQVPQAAHLIAALRRADGIILGSPGYHGGISGLMKNAVDYVEEMSSDPAPYFDGRAVGCIVTAAGWQATATTLAALRGVIHALRGWPTPFGATINTAEDVFDGEGGCRSPRVQEQLEMVARQVVDFAFQRIGAANGPALLEAPD